MINLNLLKISLYCLAVFSMPFELYSDSLNMEWAINLNNTAKREKVLSLVDSDGYIYVAGTFSNESNIDWMLKKIHPSGDTIFTTNFNGENNGDDFLKAIAIDNYNNVFIYNIIRLGFLKVFF